MGKTVTPTTNIFHQPQITNTAMHSTIEKFSNVSIQDSMAREKSPPRGELNQINNSQIPITIEDQEID